MIVNVGSGGPYSDIVQRPNKGHCTYRELTVTARRADVGKISVVELTLAVYQRKQTRKIFTLASSDQLARQVTEDIRWMCIESVNTTLEAICLAVLKSYEKKSKKLKKFYRKLDSL